MGLRICCLGLSSGSLVHSAGGPGLAGADPRRRPPARLGSAAHSSPSPGAQGPFKALGSHLKPGNARTGNPLPPKQFLALRMRGAQLKQNDPHLLISSVATKRLAIYAPTLNKDIWLFPGKQVHFCMAELREEASLSRAYRPPGCSRLRIRPSRPAGPAGVQAQFRPATGGRALTTLPARALLEASEGITAWPWAQVLGL